MHLFLPTISHLLAAFATPAIITFAKPTEEKTPLHLQLNKQAPSLGFWVTGTRIVLSGYDALCCTTLECKFSFKAFISITELL